MIIASLRIFVFPEKHQDALQIIRAILGRTRVQPGCISINFYQDTNDPNIMMLLEEWEDWRSLESHVRSDSYRSILELIELSFEEPEIKFSNVSSTKGIEVIEKLRG